MTEQYQQTNVNQQRPARYVDQSNVDAITPILGLPAVTLGNDATFILLAGVAGPPTDYGVVLPNVQTVQGYFFFFRNASGANVVIVPSLGSGQVIDGAPSITVLPTQVAIIVSDPVNNNTTPPTLPIGWTLIKNGAA